MAFAANRLAPKQKKEPKNCTHTHTQFENPQTLDDWKSFSKSTNTLRLCMIHLYSQFMWNMSNGKFWCRTEDRQRRKFFLWKMTLTNLYRIGKKLNGGVWGCRICWCSVSPRYELKHMNTLAHLPTSSHKSIIIPSGKTYFQWQNKAEKSMHITDRNKNLLPIRISIWYKALIQDQLQVKYYRDWRCILSFQIHFNIYKCVKVCAKI